jgi:hypothetical protein
MQHIAERLVKHDMSVPYPQVPQKSIWPPKFSLDVGESLHRVAVGADSKFPMNQSLAPRKQTTSILCALNQLCALSVFPFIVVHVNETFSW